MENSLTVNLKLIFYGETDIQRQELAELINLQFSQSIESVV